MVKVPGGTRTKPGGMLGASEVAGVAEPSAEPFRGAVVVTPESDESVAVSGVESVSGEPERSSESSAVSLGHPMTAAKARSAATSEAASSMGRRVRLAAEGAGIGGDVDCPDCQGATVESGRAVAAAGAFGTLADCAGVRVAAGNKTANLSWGETRLRT
jgi:hypothetical protein